MVADRQADLLQQTFWGTSENNRKAKFYGLMRKGRATLATERGQWERFSEAVGWTMEAG